MKRVMLVILFVLLLAVPAQAGDLLDRLEGDKLEEALTEEARAYLEEITPEDPGELGQGLGQVVTGVLEQEGVFKQAISLSVRLLAIVLLSGVMGAFGTGGTRDAVTLGAVLAVGLSCMGRLSGYFTSVAQTVDSISSFSGFLFTTLAGATAATGAVGTASVLYTVTVGVCGVMTRLLQTIFLPAVSCYLAMMVAAAAVGDGGLSMAGDLMKQGLTLVLKAGVIAFTAYLSLSGVVKGSADSASIRAAKLAISTAVPVVGSLLADASETLLVSAGLLRSGVGIFGMLGVLAISLGPFLEIGMGYLALKITAAVAATTGEKQLSGLISSMAAGFGMLTALVGVCALMIIIACVCFLQAGTGGL